MSELAEFLLARIAEDEEAAIAVAPLGHNFDMGGNRQDQKWTHARLKFASEDGYPSTESDPRASAHFRRHEPTRVLAECAAKRAIIEARYDPRDIPGGYGDGWSSAWEHMIRIMAQTYTDHPNFREEWRQ